MADMALDYFESIALSSFSFLFFLKLLSPYFLGFVSLWLTP